MIRVTPAAVLQELVGDDGWPDSWKPLPVEFDRPFFGNAYDRREASQLIVQFTQMQPLGLGGRAEFVGVEGLEGPLLFVASAGPGDRVVDCFAQSRQCL